MRCFGKSIKQSKYHTTNIEDMYTVLVSNDAASRKEAKTSGLKAFLKVILEKSAKKVMLSSLKKQV